jgi:CubicO group peptidase (beta-lactamase class C family)
MRFFFVLFAALFVSPGALWSDSPLTFPTKDWPSIKASEIGWNQKALDKAVEFVMSRRSSGVVILHKGKIVAEKYQEVKGSLRYRAMTIGKDSSGRSIEDVASVQKSVVCLLVGIAQEKKLVKVDDSVSKHLGVGWSQATPEQEKAITIKHLLSMSSGLSDHLRYVSPPGTKWRYNTTAYAQSLQAIAKAAGKTENELTAEWLTNRIGMNDSKWVRRRGAANSKVPVNQFGFATTARDLARFGLFALARGKWESQTILADQEYFKAAWSPSQPMNRSYGYLWWLNGQRTPARGLVRAREPLLKTAPKDLVAGLGAMGRKCYVVPSLDLVVTRLGDTPDMLKQPKFDTEFWRLLMKAMPLRK